MTAKTSAPAPGASLGAPHNGHRASHTRMVRVSAYSVATVLALLMTTATLPPLLADQSDRAVINAPISLLTAPIAGEMSAVVPGIGQRLAQGETVARIHNARIDRTTLIILDGKVSELRGSLLAARQKRESDEAYVAALDAEIKRQVEQTVAKLDGEVTEAKARVAGANAEGQSTKAVVYRQQSMVDRNAASIDLLRPTQFKLEAAKYDKEAENAKLSQKVAELAAVRKNVFVGNQSNSLAVLTQKRRDLAFDAQRLAIEETQLASSLKTQAALLDAENKRLDSLTDAQMRAPNGGVVLSLGAAQGRHVNPGDSVATLVDCDQAFAVGIFSYRQAQDLAVGTPVTISSGSGASQPGRVSEILPKTSDKTDQLYAVPFPQTERREMYVLVSLERPAGDPSLDRLRPTSRTSPCSVGQWVTITRENGWIPSASVAWKAVASGFTGPEAQAGWTMVSTNMRDAASAVSDRVRQVAAWIAPVGDADAAHGRPQADRRVENLR